MKRLLIIALALLVITIGPIEALALGASGAHGKSSAATSAVSQKLATLRPAISQKLTILRQSLKSRLAGLKLNRGTINPILKGGIKRK